MGLLLTLGENFLISQSSQQAIHFLLNRSLLDFRYPSLKYEQSLYLHAFESSGQFLDVIEGAYKVNPLP